jgi:competence protein ComEC
MKNLSAVFAASLLALLLPGASVQGAPAQQTGNLEIYWIDVEGGASTLFVAPDGQSLLFDTGYAGNGDRDAKRIYAAAQQAGVRRIDHLVISHWHADHEGGLEALSKLIPIGHFYDHGDEVQPEDRARRDNYTGIAGANRSIVRAGDTIAFDGVETRVVVSEGPVIATPLSGGGAPNPLCANAAQMEPAPPENIRMVGLSFRFGNFRMASLGDLDWSRELQLVCPVNKLGTFNLYTINRHGGLADSGSPALLGAIRPQVIVVNNGPRKGLGQRDERVKPIASPGAAPYEQNSYLRMAKTPGVEDVWQLHLSLLDSDPAHNTKPDMIANLAEGAQDQGNWIHASVRPNGTFTIASGRTAFSKTYNIRR